MRYAVNKDGFITNVIVAKPEQKEEMETALCAVLEDASVYGLTTGDLWVDGKGWTRNIDGEQVVLEALPNEERSQYQSICDELDSLKATSVSIEELEEAYDEGVQSL
jgi:hypothetical protein